MKLLYTFKVGKPSFVETTVKNEDGSETITKTKSEEKVEVYIKKPSHREIDEMDLFYSIQISDLQSKGVATNTMILNSYEDSGGLDSQKEVLAMKNLVEEIKKKRNQFLKEQAEGIYTEHLMEELKNMSVKLEEYQQNLQSVFERSAESIAERRVSQWAVFNLIYIKDAEEYKHVFKGANYENKLNFYYDVLDDETGHYEFEQKVFTKGALLISSWLKRRLESQEDFELLESYIDEELKEYV